MRANALSISECLGSRIARGAGAVTALGGGIGAVVFGSFVGDARSLGKEPDAGSIAGLAISLVALVGSGIIGINRTTFYSSSGECTPRCF